MAASHPLTPYLAWFQAIGWNLVDGGDLTKITLNNVPLSNPQLLSQLSQPLNIGAFTLGFYDQDNDEVKIRRYPAGLSFIQILGAINTRYRSSHRENIRVLTDVERRLLGLPPATGNEPEVVVHFKGLDWDPEAQTYIVSVYDSSFLGNR